MLDRKSAAIYSVRESVIPFSFGSGRSVINVWREKFYVKPTTVKHRQTPVHCYPNSSNAHFTLSLHMYHYTLTTYTLHIHLYRCHFKHVAHNVTVYRTRRTRTPYTKRVARNKTRKGREKNWWKEEKKMYAKPEKMNWEIETFCIYLYVCDVIGKLVRYRVVTVVIVVVVNVVSAPISMWHQFPS